MTELVARYARTHGPFRSLDVAERFRVPATQAEAVLRSIEASGGLVHGDFRPGGHEREWCDPEILRRIKRRTLAKLRNEVAPVERIALARFLPAWHGVGGAAIGGARLEESVERLEGLPLSYAELERAILPARVRGFAPRMLDELGAIGWLVWIGHGSLGPDDGRIALYRRDRVARLVEPPALPDTLDDRHRRILDHLEKRGASFFVELEAACGAPSRTDALEALWDLVWSGLVTNDTFQALRSLRMRRSKKAARRKSADSVTAGGRWSLVRDLCAGAPAPTERAHARAVALLDRHGLVSREHAAIEAGGGFAATYRVLRAMEEAGKVRRGYFVEGLSGAQFAYAGAVDRLRGKRSAPDVPEVPVLSAVDPASVWGWLLPWPETTEVNTSPPRRVAGATVVLVDGEPVLFLDRRGRRLRTFKDRTAPELLSLAVRALDQARTGKLLRIEHIDGAPARTSPHAPLLRASGFGADHRGLTLERR
jgi:ATP-dependent Lhr-like helicase